MLPRKPVGQLMLSFHCLSRCALMFPNGNICLKTSKFNENVPGRELLKATARSVMCCFPGVCSKSRRKRPTGPLTFG